MDPLSLSVSIAGLATLAQTVVEKGYKYLRAVKDCGKDVRELMVETNVLCGVIDRLAKLAKDNEDDEGRDTLNGSLSSYGRSLLADKTVIATIPDYVAACRRTLDEIHDILQKFETEAEKTRLAVNASVDAKALTPKKGNVMALLSRADLKWPLSKTRTLSLIQVLERHKSTCSLALSMTEISSMRSVLDQTRAIKDDVIELKADQKKLLQMNMAQEKARKLKQIRRWLSPVDPAIYHSTAREMYQKDTGRWIFDIPEYIQWIQSSESALWIHAIPGAGKTMLASLIIENVSSSRDIGFAYFYCSYKNVDSQRPTNILGSLIVQLAHLNPGAFQEVWEYYENCSLNGGRPDRPNEATLCKLLKSISRKFDEVTIVIDGLDECGSAAETFEVDRPQFVLTLATLHNATFHNIRLLILSRDEVDIRAGLRDFPSISIAAKLEDLRRYVDTMSSKLKVKDQVLRHEMIETLANGAEGMFEWVRCQIDYLGLLPTDRERRKALKKLPPTLPAIYIRLLEYLDSRFPPVTQVYIRRTLTWLTVATAPLSMPELAEAISIDENSGTFDREAIPDEAAVRQWCSTFIKVEPKTKLVTLSHFTVKEFLESDESTISSSVASKYLVSRQEAFNYIVHTILTYLSSDVFNRVWSEFNNSDNVEGVVEAEIRNAYRFYDYAASRLPEYLNHYDYELEESIPFRRLFTDKPTNAFYLMCLYWNTRRTQGRIDRLSSVATASGLLLPRTVERLLDEGGNPNYGPDSHQTPLSLAINYTLRTLKYKGIFQLVPCDTSDKNFKLRRLEVVKLLISAGANINTPVQVLGIYKVPISYLHLPLCSPLSSAITIHLSDVSLLLLERGARVTQDVEGLGAQYVFLKFFLFEKYCFRYLDMNKVLEIIVERSNDIAVQDLVEQSKNDSGYSMRWPSLNNIDREALRIALDEKEWQMAGALLPKVPLAAHYPLCFSSSSDGRAALQNRYSADSLFSVFDGRDEPAVVDLAIRHGLLSKSDIALFHIASWLNNPSKAQSQHSSNLGTISQTGDLGKVIHRAARMRDSRYLETLISNGRDLNERDAHGNTPLHYAAQIPLPRNVELLVQNGARVHLTTGKWGENSLHTALIKDYHNVFDILLRETTDKDDLIQAMNSTTDCVTVLFIAASQGMLDPIKQLLDAGAKVDLLPDSKNPWDTPLFAACHSGHREVVELLLSRGAQLEVPDTMHGTARKAARDGGQDEILTVLDEWEQSRSSRVDLKPDNNAQAWSAQELEVDCENVPPDSKDSPLPSGEITVSTQVAGACDTLETDSVQVTDLPKPLKLTPPSPESSASGTSGHV
ncbi:hypothetical protein MMC27_001699 [Xylographa pallens]|nr:hypothetical protein [Xylographa pallens]